MDLIAGVVFKKLRVIPDDRGYLMECLRSDDEAFGGFGQAYISAVYQDVVKAWHLHREQTDFVVCVHGMIKLALFDDRGSSPTKGRVNEFVIGEQQPALVKIPKGIYHGWMGLTPGLSLVLNCPDRVYDYAQPDEHRLPAHTPDIPYDWRRQDH